MSTNLYFYDGEPEERRMANADFAFKAATEDEWVVTKNRLTGITGNYVTWYQIQKLVGWIMK